MPPLGLGRVALIAPHQHGGSLLPGGREGGQKFQLVLFLHPIDDVQMVGDGNVPPVFRHIGEGKVGTFQAFGQRAVAQPPHQHHRHFRAGDVVVGPEGPGTVDGVMVSGGGQIG